MGFCFGLSALAFEVFPGEHLAHIEGLALASASIGIYPSKVQLVSVSSQSQWKNLFWCLAHSVCRRSFNFICALTKDYQSLLSTCSLYAVSRQGLRRSCYLLCQIWLRRLMSKQFLLRLYMEVVMKRRYSEDGSTDIRIKLIKAPFSSQIAEIIISIISLQFYGGMKEQQMALQYGVCLIKNIMNNEQNCPQTDQSIPQWPNNPQPIRLNSKYLSARSCSDNSDTEEVVYENRIFNVRKKFTVPAQINEAAYQRKSSIINHEKIRAKPSGLFSKHSDNVVKNRRLLRRGVWEMPFEPDTIAEVKHSRYKTQQQYSPEQAKKSEKHLLYSAQYKPSAEASTRDVFESRTRQLPALKSSHQIGLPIRLSTRYGTKPLSSKITQVQQGQQVRNAMSRRLAVELINYRLLSKWASSSMKL